MNNTPTPRTDAEIEDWVNGLNHMADDHRCCRATVLETIELIKELRRERDTLERQRNKGLETIAALAEERDQLRNAADELFWLARMADYDSQRRDNALESYYQLPHVLERKTK